MQSNRETVLCHYHYDPLDRLVASTPLAQANTQRFYLKDRLATEIQGAVQRSIMQHEDQLLAQHQYQSGNVQARLLATDQQRSVLNVLDPTRRTSFTYTPYGHRPMGNGLLSLLGFNGERPDLVTGHYLLGNGYRAFNPVLMRFNSPDSWSPFGAGGLNTYAYCAGDPMNFADPTGHVLQKIFSFMSNFMDDIATTTRQAITRGKLPVDSMSTERQYLNDVAKRDSNPEPYVSRLLSVNENLASHGNNSLTMPQAEKLVTIVQQINNGKISNTSAHLEEAVSWAERFTREKNGTTFSGAILNLSAAGMSGAVDKNMRTTGLALRRGSAFTPR
ncbi:RHS repeat-associated core domain-containing protein [Pseudomonas mohnii]|uniref:RHS repeat-associated core domain-containing protein n=1 Tax=Pseudomonas mohnii TaxID=395600 RepID=UPI001F54D8BA|nr:RHS repeat-associated core domain-containing protein [Pseudomonas mohnii]